MVGATGAGSRPGFQKLIHSTFQTLIFTSPSSHGVISHVARALWSAQSLYYCTHASYSGC